MKPLRLNMVAMLGLVLVLAVALAACETNGEVAEDEPYTIGVMESVTGPGERPGS